MENWYVAKTRFFRGEIKMRDTLAGLGVEAFVPVRIGRKTRGHGVTRTPAVPNLVFLKATKEEACALVTERFLPLNYVVDCATRRMMVVPEASTAVSRMCSVAVTLASSKTNEAPFRRVAAPCRAVS